MSRKPNTNIEGNNFTIQTIKTVWNRAQIIEGQDPGMVRKDRCGAIIEFNKYGNTTENGTGWEIDHIHPVAQGGGDDLGNLQPLQWQNNRKKSDDYPALTTDYCVIVST